ncbi:hypothetical protein GQ43DRAFT_468172 [Delitschia confertaspora ATCC 74209]|uniref:Uncharacterized protein n=1 Tax=Delitschia confertaspora ATCC 74209 TaxID=1513339 RepID=A0A9P4MW50_9PLEO|nr:hypothetical protein GQ43DRAFT_468172 [Delitschia confertaspora ATCC 74209]
MSSKKAKSWQRSPLNAHHPLSLMELSWPWWQCKLADGIAGKFAVLTALASLFRKSVGKDNFDELWLPGGPLSEGWSTGSEGYELINIIIHHTSNRDRRRRRGPEDETTHDSAAVRQWG